MLNISYSALLDVVQRPSETTNGPNDIQRCPNTMHNTQYHWMRKYHNITKSAHFQHPPKPPFGHKHCTIPPKYRCILRCNTKQHPIKRYTL